MKRAGLVLVAAIGCGGHEEPITVGQPATVDDDAVAPGSTRAYDYEGDTIESDPGEAAMAVEIPPAAAPGTGKLQSSEIRREIKRHLAQIENCYHARLVERPDYAVTVTITFAIGPDGAIGAVAASDVGDPELQGCMEAVIAGMTFRGDGSTVTVTYPFELRPAPTVDKAALRSEIRRHLAKIEYCYKSSGVDYSVNVPMTFTVGADGWLTDVSAGDVGHADLEACLVRVFEGMKLDDAPPVRITYPLQLAASP